MGVILRDNGSNKLCIGIFLSLLVEPFGLLLRKACYPWPAVFFLTAGCAAGIMAMGFLQLPIYASAWPGEHLLRG